MVLLVVLREEPVVGVRKPAMTLADLDVVGAAVGLAVVAAVAGAAGAVELA